MFYMLVSNFGFINYVFSVGSSGLGIIKKGGGVELIINELLLIKNLSFLMLLDSIRLLL